MAAQYDHHLLSDPHNVLARNGFRDLGLDAQHFGGRGYRVLAYDNSSGMIAQLEQRRAEEIATNPDLLDSPSVPRHRLHLWTISRR
jgi:hypothetical protein